MSTTRPLLAWWKGAFDVLGHPSNVSVVDINDWQTVHLSVNWSLFQSSVNESLIFFIFYFKSSEK